ncbi:MAG: FHA domain-containing protein [Thermoanaerobaculales bacterium]|jgi:DNA-binding NtrC family response regulator|nr:FHA domain-containing protein [Thermoanaerobaculales bacterium]
MLTLVIEGSSGSQLTYQLDKQAVSIGASSRNDIVLRAPGVAPQHLVIQRNDDVFTFVVQSRQVVVLNGERRSRGVLKVGDKIRIGTSTVIFKGADQPRAEVDLVEGVVPDRPSVAPDRPAVAPTSRSEVVLFREPHRLSEARAQLVELFRARMRSDLIPSLRTLFQKVFPDRRALLALVDEEGRFQPVVSQWEGDLPRLPARTFEELASAGRYAVLQLAGRHLVIYPVDRGQDRSSAILLAQTDPEGQDDDRELLGELARMLAIHWDGVERSTALYGAWASAAQAKLEADLPGTSQPVRILRDSVGSAARSPSPVMLCGRPGSGRMFLANLIASLRPAGEPPVRVFQARTDDDAGLRVELFGSSEDSHASELAERSRGAVVVLRDVHLLTPALQRELAAAVAEDLESPYGPGTRWIVTTGDDATAMLNEGVLDVTLFRQFERHVIRVPSLSDRREDLPLLIVRLLERVGAEQGKEIRGIELETLNSLLEHPFEGEMTELLGELRRLVSATADGEMVRGLVPRRQPSGPDGEEVDAESVVTSLVGSDDLKEVLPGIERLIIDRVMRRVRGNQSKGARILNLSRGALISKIKDYDIPDYRTLRR